MRGNNKYEGKTIRPTQDSALLLALNVLLKFGVNKVAYWELRMKDCTDQRNMQQSSDSKPISQWFAYLLLVRGSPCCQVETAENIKRVVHHTSEQHKNVAPGHSPKQLWSEISPTDRIQMTESPHDVQNLLLRLQVQLCHTHNTWGLSQKVRIGP